MTTNSKKITEDFITVVIIVGLILSLAVTYLQPYVAYTLFFLLILLALRVYQVKKQTIFVKRKAEVSSSDWEQYWSDRTFVVNNVSSTSIVMTQELKARMTSLIENLGRIGFEDCEKALTIGAVWTNGLATPEELARIGSLWLETTFEKSDMDRAYKSLIDATILLPAKTFPKTDKDVCLISSLDRIDVAIENLLKIKSSKDFERWKRLGLVNSAKKLLTDFAIGKSDYMLWPFSPNGTVKIVQPRYPGEVIEDLEPAVYPGKVLEIVKRASSRLLISLEYGTGITKEPLEKIIWKLEEGITIEVCIATKPFSISSGSEAEKEWEKTNETLRSLKKYGNVVIYEVPEPYHSWHMWLSIVDNNPMEGIGFFRNGSLPFWHETYYAQCTKATKTLRDLYGHWKEMTENGHWCKKYC
jgi:hypothetical protein